MWRRDIRYMSLVHPKAADLESPEVGGFFGLFDVSSG